MILARACEERLTLLTYDRHSIAPLLKERAEAGRSHSGVVFVDEKSIPPHDLGALVRALCQLWDAQGELDWTDRVIF